MVQKLEAIKGGGGSIKVGTTGTISALMTRELESTRSSPKAPISLRDKPRTVPVSVPSRADTPKKMTMRKSLDEASSSSSSRTIKNCGSNKTIREVKTYTKSAQRMPILVSENITLGETPRREKGDQKRTNIVEVVDIKCGKTNTDRAWAKLKKLGFSKLSETII